MEARKPLDDAHAWFQVIEADSPLLLIAPHGGHAGPAARAAGHPKVNDLYTAQITRELARHLDASALINFAMDRNRLDCNRISQLAAEAPWMLDTIAAAVARIVGRHGRATVLLIHGWNIIEPRVDLGLGLRMVGGELRPPGSAQVSASNDFINGPVLEYASLLRSNGIKPSFGMRYPAGASHNLVQAFTARHRDSSISALRDLAAISARGAVDAAQLELSVAVRMPGRLRDGCIQALRRAFLPERDCSSAPRRRLTIVRDPAPRPAVANRKPAPIPTRVGLEFYDPHAGIGAMVSFDLTGGFGARIMLLMPNRKVALCTCEGRVQHAGDGLMLGPLSLESDNGELVLKFSGPAVIVPDGSHYLSIERALASGHLDTDVMVELRMHLSDSARDRALFDVIGDDANPREPRAVFAPMRGEIRIDGARHPINAVARTGVSFTGLGQQKFRLRRMIWTSFAAGDDSDRAIEVRTVIGDDGSTVSEAASVGPHARTPREFISLEIDTPRDDAPPDRIVAHIGSPNGTTTLVGDAKTFVPLSRPGPDQSRIYTTLGFAEFTMGARRGAGMFEYSRMIATQSTAANDDSELEPE